MPSAPALHFLLLTFSGWVNRQQRDVIAYLIEENHVLREQLGKQLSGRRVRFIDDQRRRLAAKGVCQLVVLTGAQQLTSPGRPSALLRPRES